MNILREVMQAMRAKRAPPAGLALRAQRAAAGGGLKASVGKMASRATNQTHRDDEFLMGEEFH